MTFIESYTSTPTFDTPSQFLNIPVRDGSTMLPSLFTLMLIVVLFIFIGFIIFQMFKQSICPTCTACTCNKKPIIDSYNE